jgi:hypothetical protein
MTKAVAGCRNALAAAIHQMMIDARNAGVISNEAMEAFDARCSPAQGASAKAKQEDLASGTDR